MTVVLTPFTLTPGTRLQRVELHDRYGGNRQAGISSASKTGCIFLFTGDAGHRYGYDYDGPQSDGSFHYTGEGQEGEQTLVRGNAAIARRDRPLHLFRMVGRGVVEYVGEFALDTKQPYYPADALDKNLAMRAVLVFRLWPVGRVSEPVPTFERGSRQIPLERHLTVSGVAEIRAETVSFTRIEADLVLRYQQYVDRPLVRYEIPISGTATVLRTDIFDPATGELIEAKGSAARFHVRMALGQLFDYRRSVQPTSLAVLLPQHPGDDLVALLHENGVACIYEEGKGRFIRLER